MYIPVHGITDVLTGRIIAISSLHNRTIESLWTQVAAEMRGQQEFCVNVETEPTDTAESLSLKLAAYDEKSRDDKNLDGSSK